MAKNDSMTIAPGDAGIDAVTVTNADAPASLGTTPLGGVSSGAPLPLPSARDASGSASAASAPPANPPGTVALSDGRTAVVRSAKGRDLRKAGAMTNGATDIFSVLVGLVAATTMIDGAAIAFEDLDEMPAMDVFALIGESVGGNALSQALKSS